MLYRHAKCKNCDHQFTYHVSAAPNNRGTRPPCPECGAQGIGGPFGRTNPAEWNGIVQEAGQGTEYDYADWLAGEAALCLSVTDDDSYDKYVFVDDRRQSLPCRITTHRDERGVGSTGFSPSVWRRWLDNGAEISLVGIDAVPDRKPITEMRVEDSG